MSNDYTYPYFPSVPLEPRKNAEYRKSILLDARQDPSLQKQLMSMCAEDSLFWISTFGLLFEPRPRPKTLLFIPWAHQIPVWKTLDNAIGHEDVGGEKSRSEGFTWIVTSLFFHKWLFWDQFQGGCVSKDEETVDNPRNPDSLMWKFDWHLRKLPKWMVGESDKDWVRTINNHTLKNLRNDATLVGFATTQNVGTAGRYTAFFFDELAKFPRGPDEKAVVSVQQTTYCRIMGSTPFGPDGIYYKIMTGESDMTKITLHWSDNPTRRIGAYKILIGPSNQRTLVLIDRNYWVTEANRNGHEEVDHDNLDQYAQQVVDSKTNVFGYEFMIEGEFVQNDRIRSPWYDKECRRPGATPKSIAQELDMDFGGSSSRHFDFNLLDRLERDAPAPQVRGDLIYRPMVNHYSDLKSPKFRVTGTGRTLLWFQPDIHGRPPAVRRYVVSCDIASGTGGIKSSNSTVCVLNEATGEQVAAYASPDIFPNDFADFAVALCHWFVGHSGQPARLIWEANGPPGTIFGNRVKDLEYPHVYFRSGSPEAFITRETKNLGWWSNNKTRAALFGEFERGLSTGELVIRDKTCLHEAKFYMNMPGGKIEHIAASSEEDPAGAGESHGDRVIACALAWWWARDLRGDDREISEADVPPNSFKARQLRARREEAAEFLWKPKSQRGSATKFLSRGALRRFKG